MRANFRSLLVAVVLVSGCASTLKSAKQEEVIGESSSPEPPADESAPTAAKAPPALNAALVEGAPESAVSAYEQLLVSADVALGDQCGPELGPTSVWRDLSVLVHDRRSAMLWDLTSRASAVESRAAAVIGLAKLRTISYAEAGDLLRRMPGTIAVCKGATLGHARPEVAADLLSHSLDGESNELAMP